VLLALPAVGLFAGILLSAAVVLMVVRGLLGTELPFVVILTTMYGVLLWLAASTVTRATRVLYTHAQLEAEAASAARVAAGDAQLAALQARMNPHFLFNALNTVAALIRTAPATAERVTEELSDVLRLTLDRSAEKRTTVAEEVEYVRKWLAVEQQRWQERLRVEWDIAPDASAGAIPPLVLQPLVENALKHGLSARILGGDVRISARRGRGILVLRVEDDGIGFPAVAAERTGLGNLRQRLAAVYGDAASLRIEPAERGASVSIELPYEEADSRAGR
jgi:LytS/YehU family sensor histidine kinase